MSNLTTLFLKIPRETEVTPESAQTFLASLTQINAVSGLQKLRGNRSQALSLEIISYHQQIRFLITCDNDLVPFVEAQLQSNYPLVIIERFQDPLSSFQFETKEITLRKGNNYPLSTYPAFQEVDPMSSILSVLSRLGQNEFAMVQLSLEASGAGWQSKGQKFADTGGPKTEEGGLTAHPDASIIKEKISYPGFYVSLRLIGNTKKTLNALASSFGVFARADGNSFTTKGRYRLLKGSPTTEARQRKVIDKQILNIAEIATIWHLPSEKIKIPTIVWGKSVLSEAPTNLPVRTSDISSDENLDTNYFGKTQFKNQDHVFGIKIKDRRRHMWVVGKTGTGKSTLMANMVIDDIQKGRGVCLIDPHGDNCETVLDYIPEHRINDVIYFNPSDREKPITINPLGVNNREEGELLVSGLMSIFTKIWANVWSARMEYILRNTLLTLVQVPDTTFADVLKILADKKYRDQVVNQINDHSLTQFWKTEYDKMPERLQKEAISPIQNKVGQFVTSPLIRRIIGNPKSSIDLDEIMNEGKILLANLSQGRLGEDNGALLGATLITKLQQAAMRRVNTKEENRRDFFLYVDEFQNFATTSFIKILSEARKYRLNLMLANQYMAQIPEEVLKAILGNVGSLISFGVGAEDADIIHKEFSEVFSQSDLVNLNNFQVAVKLMVNGQVSRPFLAHTLPIPAQRNNLSEKVIQMSRNRWGRTPAPPKPVAHHKPQPQQHRKPNRPNPHRKILYTNPKKK